MRAYLFDMDGVLVRTEALHFGAYVGLFEARGVRFTLEDYRRVGAGRPREQVLRTVLGPLEGDALAALMAEKQQRVEVLVAERGVDLIPGAEAFVARSRAAGLRQAVATSSRSPALFLGAMAARFDAVVDRGQVAHGKPAPDLFLRAAALLGAAPADCLVFEDAPAGVEAARAAGMRVVALSTSHSPEALSDADRVVPDFRALADELP